MPSFLPDWVPPWVQLVLLVGVVLVVGAYGVMPFSVFGVKSRLEAIEERLDELQSDLRALTNRLPDPEMRNPAAWRRGAAEDEELASPPIVRRDRPPVPPVPDRGFDRDWDRDRDRTPTTTTPPVAPPSRPRRSEPQLNWPENRPRS